METWEIQKFPYIKLGQWVPRKENPQGLGSFSQALLDGQQEATVGYKKLQEVLKRSFHDNVQKIRRKKMFGNVGEQLSLPTLSGPSGIGKTACIEEFATTNGFKLIKMDCSYEPSNFVVIHLNNAIISLSNGKIKGLVLHLDFINEADEELIEIIKQYKNNTLNSYMKVAKVDNNGEPFYPVEYRKMDVIYENLPETIFIVGEQR